MQGREIKFECIYRPTKEKFVPAKIDFVNGDVYGDFDGEKYAYCCYSTEPDGYGDAWLRQFTGLHDKNGREIYEGDIALIDGDRCVIEYDLKSASYVARTKIDSYWALDERTFKLGVEVIGNIYENPELLEVGN